MRTMTRITRPALLAATLALVGTACGGGGGDDGDGVASLGADATTTTEGGSGPGGGGRSGDDSEFQDAMLEFAECMRDQGIDFPDPQVSGDGGGVVIMGPADGRDGPPSEAEMREMDAAQEECQPILEEAEGSMERPSPEEEAEMQERALAFAECMREHGIDFPDPEFGEGGRMTQRLGDGSGGIDPNDDDFQAAQEECGESSGFGAGPAGPAPEED